MKSAAHVLMWRDRHFFTRTGEFSVTELPKCPMAVAHFAVAPMRGWEDQWRTRIERKKGGSFFPLASFNAFEFT